MGILGGGSTSYFDKQLENATSQLQLEPNWQAILDICDCIRQKDVPAKYAVQSIKKKAFDKNPHVSKFSLVVLEACMKNCGTMVHDEVSNKDFMDDLRSLAKNGSPPVKEQVLTLLQAWNNVFRNKPTYKIFQDTYDLMKMEGYEFPAVAENDAMFSAETAPEWAEGDVCNMCRVKFSAFTRQHHCRCCGEVFCGKCSSKSSIIPKFGIEKEVRVCDPCYDVLNPQGAQGSTTSTPSSSSRSKGEDKGDLPSEYLNHPLSKEAQVKPKASEDELKAQEEEELQLAMALSLSAQEADKTPASAKKWSSLSSATTTPQPASAPPAPYQEAKSDLYSDVSSKLNLSSDSADPELSRYLNRSYWEERKKQEKSKSEPSAPMSNGADEPAPTRAQVQRYVPGSSDNEQEDGSEVLVQTMRNSLGMFMERMQNLTAEGKHIAMDTSVQSLFQSLSAMHPQLMRLVEDQENQKAQYEAMLQKIAVIREARESLDDVRAQHKEKLRQQELEQEMLRRMQMEQKLELMRQQKQEYLEYQHQLQVQRQQDLEVQQQLKMQQKQMTQQVPGAYPPSMPTDPAFARQYPGYSQYPPAGEGSINNQPPSLYAQQDVAVARGPPVSDPANAAYQVRPNVTEYPSSSFSGQPQIPPGSYGAADQQLAAMDPSQRAFLAQQHPQGGYKSPVPASAYDPSSSQLGGPPSQGMQTTVQQPAPGIQSYEAQRGSQVPVSNLLDAPIGSDDGVPSSGYAPPNYGMSGPNSQDFNQPAYTQQQATPQGQVAYTAYPAQPPQQQMMAPGQQMVDPRLQGQPASYAQQQQPQQGPPLTTSQQPQQPNVYPQQRPQGPLATPEPQGHVSPQAQHRVPQPYGGQQQPASLQYAGPQDQGVLSRGGPTSLPPNMNAYPNGVPPPNYRPQDGMSQPQSFVHQQAMQQPPQMQQQPPQMQQQPPQMQQHPMPQQQPLPQQQSIQQMQPLPQQYAVAPPGYGPQHPANPQQDIPANSHLRDMALISFD